MTIGEALKEERNKLGMSKYQFSKGVIDRKFYGEVEDKGKNIGSEALVKLLFKHGIDINNFFNKLEDTYAPTAFKIKKKINIQLDEAIIAHDLNTIQECSKSILELEGESSLWLRSQVVLAYLEEKTKSLPKSFIAKIDQKLDEHENLSTDSEAIKLFANTLPIMDMVRVEYFMKIILTKVKKKKLTPLEEERIARLCNNFINLCRKKNFKSKYIQASLDYLLELEDVHFLIYKMVGKFDYELLRGNLEEAAKIKSNLNELGYEKLTRNLKK